MTTPTKEFITDGGVKFVLNEYITYGQHRELTNIYLSKKEDTEMSQEADKKSIEMVVFSINEKTENVYAEFLKLPFSDVQGVLKEVKKIVNPKD